MSCHVAAAAARRWEGHQISFGVSYDSSAVDDDEQTTDLPADEELKLNSGLSSKRSRAPRSTMRHPPSTLEFNQEGNMDEGALVDRGVVYGSPAGWVRDA